MGVCFLSYFVGCVIHPSSWRQVGVCFLLGLILFFTWPAGGCMFFVSFKKFCILERQVGVCFLLVFSTRNILHPPGFLGNMKNLDDAIKDF